MPKEYAVFVPNQFFGNNSGKLELTGPKFCRETWGHVACCLANVWCLCQTGANGPEKTHFANILSTKQHIVSPTSQWTISVKFERKT